MKLDIGCGTRKREGHIGADCRPFPGVDVVADIGKDRWPWEDDSVDEVWCSHTVEHLKPPERVHFANELYRVLKKGAKATIITPHWCSGRSYGDLTHEWPPVSEHWYQYLNKAWRDVNAPHNDAYTCDFQYPAPISYAPHPALAGRNMEFLQDKLSWSKEAAQDTLVTVTK